MRTIGSTALPPNIYHIIAIAEAHMRSISHFMYDDINRSVCLPVYGSVYYSIAQSTKKTLNEKH